MKSVVLLSIFLLSWIVASLLEIRQLRRVMNRDSERFRDMRTQLNMYRHQDSLNMKMVSFRLSSLSSPKNQ